MGSTHSFRQAGATVLVCWCLLGSGNLTAADPASRTVVDELGRTLQVPSRITRIVSLAPSLTETVYALGLGEKLVGVSSFCDFPPDVASKTRVGPPMDPSIETIVDLRPDVVLGSTTSNDSSTVEKLSQLGISLYGVTDPRTIEEIFDSTLRLADLLGAVDEGRELIKRQRRALAQIETSIASVKHKPTVLAAIWLEPLIASGARTFLTNVIERAGSTSITHNVEDDWPRLSLEFVAERDPDVLILTRAHGIRESFLRLSKQPPWSELRAVRENRVLWIDDALFRPGPRTVLILARLARELHGSEFTEITP